MPDFPGRSKIFAQPRRRRLPIEKTNLVKKIDKRTLLLGRRLVYIFSVVNAGFKAVVVGVIAVVVFWGIWVK
jgi:hypothetical protein